MEKQELIYKKIPLIMKAVGVIAKGRQNQIQRYNFRGIDDMYASIQPAFIEHGVFCVPQVIERSREERQTKNGGVLVYTILKVRFIFYAEDGSSVDCVTVGEAMDSADKSSNKAMSAAQKYAFIQTLSIPTEGDNDTENSSHELSPKKGYVPGFGKYKGISLSSIDPNELEQYCVFLESECEKKGKTPPAVSEFLGKAAEVLSWETT